MWCVWNKSSELIPVNDLAIPAWILFPTMSLYALIADLRCISFWETCFWLVAGTKWSSMIRTLTYLRKGSYYILLDGQPEVLHILGLSVDGDHSPTEA